MNETRIVATSGGPVEVMSIPGERPPVLFFPGGHCSAACDCGWSLYTECGHGVVSFSRPGYGGTRVGHLSPSEFALLVREVCCQLDVNEAAAAVGVSFGGMQAVHVALQPSPAISRLILHSCAPSRQGYPDTIAEAVGGRIIFSPLVEGLVWRVLDRVVGSETGLRRMMARLSNTPVDDWWDELTSRDHVELRDLFRAMRSDSGFVNDLRNGRHKNSSERADALSKVRSPTLVTGSRHDRGVSFSHAEDLAAAIADADLVELESWSHIFWIGGERARLASIIEEFLHR